MKWFLFLVAVVHAGFAVCELFPWGFPLLLKIASKKLPNLENGNPWTNLQLPLVATIVHNAGIYNAILAGGLFWVALAFPAARDMTQFLLIGAAVAGIFGAVTLKSPVPAIQALLGIIGLVLLKQLG
jgi:uncharacterized membrane protein